MAQGAVGLLRGAEERGIYFWSCCFRLELQRRGGDAGTPLFVWVAACGAQSVSYSGSRTGSQAYFGGSMQRGPSCCDHLCSSDATRRTGSLTQFTGKPLPDSQSPPSGPLPPACGSRARGQIRHRRSDSRSVEDAETNSYFCLEKSLFSSRKNIKKRSSSIWS